MIRTKKFISALTYSVITLLLILGCFLVMKTTAYAEGEPSLKVTLADGVTETEYTDPTEAITFADANEGSRLTLLADVSCAGESYYLYGKWTLDLNGYEIGDLSIASSTNGDLTIDDSSEGKTGVFREKSATVSLSAYRGRITVNGGNIHSNIVLNFGETSSLVINGGSFVKSNFEIDSDMGSVAIKGGSFVSMTLTGDEEFCFSDILEDGYMMTDQSGAPIDHTLTEYKGALSVVSHTHDSGTPDFDAESHFDRCTVCKKIISDTVEAHTGTEATCSMQSYCSVCENYYGDTLPHIYSDLICAECGASPKFTVTKDSEVYPFDSLEQAIDKAISLDGGCVKMFTDVTLRKDYSIRGNLTIDFNGYGIFDYFPDIYGTVVITDTSEEKTGLIDLKTKDKDYLWICEGTVTMENITVIGNIYIENDSVVYITDVTFKGASYGLSVFDNASVIIYSGSFDGVYSDIHITDEAQVKVHTAVFPNDMSVDGSNVMDIIADSNCYGYYDEENSMLLYSSDSTELDGQVILRHKIEICESLKDENKHWLYCETCDKIYDEQPHSFTNYESDGNATCIADGTKTAVCDGCDFTDTVDDVGSKLGHDFGDATCTSPKTCKRDGCDETEGDPLGHDYADATCTSPKTCKRGDCAATEGEPLGHDYADATCTSPKTCKRYGCTATEGKALDHDYADATCTSPMTCKRDGCAATQGKFLGHSYTAATCTSPRTCKRDGCGKTLGEPLGHDYADATCASPKTCKRDGCDETEGEPLGHDYADATCTAPKTCKRDGCGATEGEALGHTEKTIAGKAATCTEKGLTDGKECSVCGEALTAQSEIPALDHKYDNACDADCNTCGKSRTPADHADADEDSVCDICGAELPKEGISGGAIAGISIGSAAVAALGGFSLFWFVIKKKKLSDLVGIFKK